jgi:hypothetical protein
MIDSAREQHARGGSGTCRVTARIHETKSCQGHSGPIRIGITAAKHCLCTHASFPASTRADLRIVAKDNDLASQILEQVAVRLDDLSNLGDAQEGVGDFAHLDLEYSSLRVALVNKDHSWLSKLLTITSHGNKRD